MTIKRRYRWTEECAVPGLPREWPVWTLPAHAPGYRIVKQTCYGEDVNWYCVARSVDPASKSDAWGTVGFWPSIQRAKMALIQAAKRSGEWIV